MRTVGHALLECMSAHVCRICRFFLAYVDPATRTVPAAIPIVNFNLGLGVYRLTNDAAFMQELGAHRVMCTRAPEYMFM